MRTRKVLTRAGAAVLTVGAALTVAPSPAHAAYTPAGLCGSGYAVPRPCQNGRLASRQDPSGDSRASGPGSGAGVTAWTETAPFPAWTARYKIRPGRRSHGPDGPPSVRPRPVAAVRFQLCAKSGTS
jgi:hypothetical protein